jgi:glucose-1-phosphatase
MNKIENIIFDFGGVLYNIDLQRSMNAFKKLGFDLPEIKDDFLPIFLNLEVGLISQATFITQLQNLSADHINENDILNAFNLVLTGIDPVKVADLRILKNKYQLFLLSNTNAIHYNLFSEEIKGNRLTTDFYTIFRKEYYSHLLGLRKPDPDIFKFVLTDSKLDPFGTLFVDDSIENISAAASLGIQTFYIENADSWKKLKIMLNIK